MIALSHSSVNTSILEFFLVSPNSFKTLSGILVLGNSTPAGSQLSYMVQSSKIINSFFFLTHKRLQNIFLCHKERYVI